MSPRGSTGDRYRMDFIRNGTNSVDFLSLGLSIYF